MAEDERFFDQRTVDGEAPPTCFGFRESTCRGVLMALAVVFIILSLVIILFNQVWVSQRDATHRACGIATGAEVLGAGSGEPAARLVYKIVFDGDTNSIHYRFSYNTTTQSAVTAIHLRGPMDAGGLNGPLVGSLCGAPDTIACDTTTTPGRVSGSLVHAIKDGVHINGVDIRPVTNAFRADPDLYYVEVMTNTAPASPGAARSQLTSQCGYV